MELIIKTNKNPKGAGAPKKPESEISKNRTMKFTDADWEKLKLVGGAKWIRTQLKLIEK